MLWVRQVENLVSKLSAERTSRLQLTTPFSSCSKTTMALSEPAEFGHPDFILLDEITEEAFLANLKLRYEKGKVCSFHKYNIIIDWTQFGFKSKINMHSACKWMWIFTLNCHTMQPFVQSDIHLHRWSCRICEPLPLPGHLQWWICGGVPRKGDLWASTSHLCCGWCCLPWHETAANWFMHRHHWWVKGSGKATAQSSMATDLGQYKKVVFYANEKVVNVYGTERMGEAHLLVCYVHSYQ